MKRTAAAFLFCAFPAMALAQDMPEGVYLTPPELCDEARRNGIESVLEQGHLMLSPRGLDGYEYHCEFVQVLKSPHSPSWVAVALCEEPGYAFPDLIAIMPRGEGELELSSVSGGGGEDAGGNVGLYALCEGVSPP